jgi:hypothetical protein
MLVCEAQLTYLMRVLWVEKGLRVREQVLLPLDYMTGMRRANWTHRF